MSNRAMEYGHLKFKLKLLIFETHVYYTLSRSCGVIYIESEEEGEKKRERKGINILLLVMHPSQAK